MDTFNCELPVGCKIHYNFDDLHFFENKIIFSDLPGIRCEIRKGYKFGFKVSQPIIPNNSCNLSKTYTEYFKLAWPMNDLLIFDSSFHFDVMIKYFTYFQNEKNFFNLVNVKGFELNILEISFSFSSLQDLNISNNINCINCQMNFYNQGKLVKSCNDILQSNITSIQSFFQLSSSYMISSSSYRYNSNLYISLYFCEFKLPLCPLVFKSLFVYTLYIDRLTNTFYEKRLFEISNETFDSLNSFLV